MNNRDLRYMALARRLAIDNNICNKRFKLGAVITVKRDIISVGYNQMRTHPFQKRFQKNEESIYLHAEINAISNALNHVNKEALRSATLYVHRVKRVGPNQQHEWADGLACPCDGCRSAVVAFGIPRVVYSTDQYSEYQEEIFR